MKPSLCYRKKTIKSYIFSKISTMLSQKKGSYRTKFLHPQSQNELAIPYSLHSGARIKVSFKTIFHVRSR